MFQSASRGDWTAAVKHFDVLREEIGLLRPSPPALRLPGGVWNRIQEVGAFASIMAAGNPKTVALFSSELFAVIPPGSVFFGGSDSGRFIVTALSTSHEKGRPFFTVTQNALVDTNYLQYLAEIYGRSLTLPDETSIDAARWRYMTGLQRRFQHDKDHPEDLVEIHPEERVRQLTDGSLEASGDGAVMEINGLVALEIMRSNSRRRFFLEVGKPSFALYPYLSPCGPIFELHQKRLDELTADQVSADQQYWNSMLKRWIPTAINGSTTLAQSCEMASTNDTSLERIPDTSGLVELQSRGAFAELRRAIAELYAWRSSVAPHGPDRILMTQCAEVAFRQAYVLCPRSMIVLRSYCVFLVNQKRQSQALELLDAAAKLSPAEPFIGALREYARKALHREPALGPLL
jgi:hypothetical protein